MLWKLFCSIRTDGHGEIFLLSPRMLQSVRRRSTIVLTVTVSGTQQIHPVIYLLLTVTVNGRQQIHPVIYLLLTLTVNGMQQIHPVDISPIDSHC